MPIISSLSSRFIPITPIEVRPVFLTSLSLNRIHCPFCVTSMISFLLLVAFTSISSSSSLRLIACNPDLRMFSYSLIGVFLTIPFFVAINKYLLFWYSFKGIIAVILSSGNNWSRFIIAVPLAVLLDSGIS